MQILYSNTHPDTTAVQIPLLKTLCILLLLTLYLAVSYLKQDYLLKETINRGLKETILLNEPTPLSQQNKAINIWVHRKIY